MGFDVFDNYECDGQMTIFDLFPAPETMFAVSKVFARAKKQMSVNELKTFIYALTNIRWTEECPEAIYLDKKTLAGVLGIHSDSDHLSQDLYEEIKRLPKTSYIEVADKDRDCYESGVIITSVGRLKNQFRIKLNKDYLPLFGNLKSDYITMWSSDIFKLRNARSIEFYEDLRLNSDTREVNSKGYGIKVLKEMFGIPKDGTGSYMRKDGHFDRPAFEKKVLKPLCDDLAKCSMIQLMPQADGLMYEKVKQNGRVLGYRFYWTVSDRPGIVDAKGMKDVRYAIEKNPQVLSVAKDIVEGKKHPEKKKNRFNDFPQNTYDFEQLEKELLSN